MHPNGEKELITINLRPRTHLKRLKFDIDLGDQLIKNRTAAGNLVTKEIISKVIQKELGGSTLSARKIWFDEIVGRLNDDSRGKFLGEFRGEDKILTLYSTGDYRLSGFDLATRFDDDLIHIEKWVPDHPISVVYYDGEKELHYAKRFICETTTDKKVNFISESTGSVLNVATTAYKPRINIVFNKLLKATKNLPDKEILLDEFIDVKGMKSQGNQLTKFKVKEVLLNLKPEDNIWPNEIAITSEINGHEEKENIEPESDHSIKSKSLNQIRPEKDEKPTEIEWDLSKNKNKEENNSDGQSSLFNTDMN